MEILAFLITALIAGVVIVYVLPLAQGWIAKAPGAARFTGNKVIQLLIIGAVVVIALHIFLGLATALTGRKAAA